MNIQKRNDVSIYCLSFGPTLPEWLGDRAKRNLSKRDESIRRRIELIQDFQMPSSSSKIVQSSGSGGADAGRYVLVAGTYPPRIRCYDVHDLGMKFERYTDSHVVDMALLGDDYGKIALLCDDRTIAFHAPYGFHESIRIPTFGRGLVYEPTTCDLLVAAKGSHVYRINLEEGRFAEPWTTSTSSSSTTGEATCIGISSSHPLTAVGCDDGVVRFWDNRQQQQQQLTPFLTLSVADATGGYNNNSALSYNTFPNEITCVGFDPSGLYMAAGTGAGLVVLYDIRSSKPYHVTEHKQGLPIHTVRFHPYSGTVLSSDEKLVKAWRYKKSSTMTTMTNNNNTAHSNGGGDVGSLFVNVEGKGKLSHFIVAGDTNDPNGTKNGLLLCATDQPKCESYYVPQLGLAPRWCSFLEHITEELEETDINKSADAAGINANEETVYENYKFVTRDEIEQLGVSKLIGTPLLRGYMHGFFMDTKFYHRIKAVANPFEYEEYRKKKIKQRLDDKQKSRIAGSNSSNKNNKDAGGVNASLVQRLQDQAGEDGSGSGKTKKKGKAAHRLLSDDRFGGLFTNPDFEIDEEDETFKLRNPSGVAEGGDSKKKRRDDVDSDDDDDDDDDDDNRYYDDDDDNDESGDDSGSSSSDDDDDEDGFQGAKVRGEAYHQMKEMTKKNHNATKKKRRVETMTSTKKNKTKMLYEADDNMIHHNNRGDNGNTNHTVATNIQTRMKEMNIPLSRRLKEQKEQQEQQSQRVSNNNTSSNKEMTYIPKQTKKESSRDGSNHNDSKRRRKRRSM